MANVDAVIAAAMQVTGPALCAWRENRNHGMVGIQSIVNVLRNRSVRDNTTMYAEAVKKLQFSSMTAKGDPELTLWPADSDPQYAQAEQMVTQSQAGQLTDLTEGSTLYYAPAGIGTTSKTFELPNGSVVHFPDTWNVDAVIYVTTIGSQLFFREK